MYQLKNLLGNISYECVKGNLEKSVNEVTYDSRKIIQNTMFICIKGANFDGHLVVKEAVEKGATVVLIQDDLSDELYRDLDATIIKVKDARYAMAFIAAAYYNHPADQLKVIGITGTKGKTTTAYLVKNILEAAGFQVGLVGTIETIIKEKTIPSAHTTPEAFQLQKYFREMVDAGCEICVMEASSQGFLMNRTQGFKFEIGIFTNISPDHISPGEHSSFEDYMHCKGLLFQQCKLGILNSDDSNYENIIKNHTCKIETFGFHEKADIRGEDVKLFAKEGYLGVEFNVKGLMNFPVKLHTPGRFSVYNALTAIAICRHFQVEEEIIQDALAKATVKGRIEMIKVSNKFTLMIDYAHNAMSLENVLSSLREYQPNRLVCLFGCGGNRAKSRRYEMGEVSGTMAELTIITSDNPRFEDPQDIINDIKTGIEKTKGIYVEIIDRKEAIRYAIEHGQPGDIIVLAGKGHEDYQEIKGVKYPLDERTLIQEILEELKTK